jgi:hypothetical protein
MKKVTLAFALALIASAALAQDVDSKPKDEAAPVSVLLAKAPEPVSYRMENSMAGGFGWIVHKMRNSSLSTALTGDMYRMNPRYMDLLNDGLVSGLKSAGVVTEEGQKVLVNPAKPWDVKWASLHNESNIVLYTYIERIGVRSSNLSSTYEPFVYVVYCLLTPAKKDDCASWGRISFGDGADVDTATSTAATPGERWATSDDVFLRVKELDQAYRRGITRISEGVAGKVSGLVPKKTEQASIPTAQ